MANHVLIAGASGVIGAAAVEHFAAQPGWQVSALSRRVPMVAKDCVFTPVPVDLADPDACARAVAALPPVTHLIYAASREVDGLVAGWHDEVLMAQNGAMLVNLLDPLAAAGDLRHVSLLQGAKAYGAHCHAVRTPLREAAPRDDHPNFYWLHEDHLRARASAAGFAFTIFRPQVLAGAAPGVAMNPVAAIGAYAALCRELGRAFAFPGQGSGLMEMTDAALLAEAFHWAVQTPAAAGLTFNVTNGDVMVLEHAWPDLAAGLGLASGGPAPESLAAFFAEPANVAAWGMLAARHRLRFPVLSDLLGQSHHYLDLLLGERIATKRVPVLMSTIRIRQAGFGVCRDSLHSLFHWLDRMAGLKLMPPLVQQE